MKQLDELKNDGIYLLTLENFNFENRSHEEVVKMTRLGEYIKTMNNFCTQVYEDEINGNANQ